MNDAALKPDQLQALVQGHARVVTALPGGAEWNKRRIEALERFVTLGLSDTGNLLVVVYTYREPDILRVISAWRANRRQELRYEKSRR